MSNTTDNGDLQNWTEKLGDLLAEARVAAQQPALAPRLDVNEKLMKFVEDSFPNTDEIKALDDIAIRAASALLDQTIEERLKSITERTGEYQKLGKQFDAIAEANETKAKSIRLEAISTFIDSTTKVVASMKALQASLNDDAADRKLGDKIEETIEAIEALRSNVGKRL